VKLVRVEEAEPEAYKSATVLKFSKAAAAGSPSSVEVNYTPVADPLFSPIPEQEPVMVELIVLSDSEDSVSESELHTG
jgi:hypothetical protein